METVLVDEVSFEGTIIKNGFHVEGHFGLRWVVGEVEFSLFQGAPSQNLVAFLGLPE